MQTQRMVLNMGIRRQAVHAGQGLEVGLHTPTILGGISYLSWCYGRGEAINRGPNGKFLPYHANVYVTIQSHGSMQVHGP